MKTFLIIVGSLLVTALIIVVCAYFWIHSQIYPSASESVHDEYLLNEAPSSTFEGTTKDSDVSVPDEGIPLKNVPLGDSQKSALETVGVEVDTFVITPAMQSCAIEKLGAERVNEIVAGDMPGVIETARLMPCLSAE